MEWIYGAGFWSVCHGYYDNRQAGISSTVTVTLALTVAAFVIKKNPTDPINPSETLRVHNKIQICSDAS